MTPTTGSAHWLQSRRGVLAVLGVVLLGAAVVFAGPIRWDQHHVDAARSALSVHDAPMAERHLARCLGWWTGRFEIHLLSGRAAREREEYSQAQEHLDAAARLDAKSTALLIEQALVSAEQGDTQRAENLLTSRWGADPALAGTLLVALALGQLRNHQPIEALWSTEQALKHQPDDARALDVGGRGSELLDKHEDALKQYQKAFERAPSLNGLRLRLAEMLYATGQPLEAAGHFEALRRVDPNQAQVCFGLARCRFELAEEDEARRLLDALLASAPEHVGGLLERGRLALRQRRFVDAEKNLRQLTTLVPGDLDAEAALRTCLDALGKVDEALACAARVRKLETETARVSRAIEKALGGTPTPAECHDIGAALLALNRPRKGLAWLYLALKFDPRHQPTRALLADYHRRNGAPDAARRHDEQATAPRLGS